MKRSQCALFLLLFSLSTLSPVWSQCAPILRETAFVSDRYLGVARVDDWLAFINHYGLTLRNADAPDFTVDTASVPGKATMVLAHENRFYAVVPDEGVYTYEVVNERLVRRGYQPLPGLNRLAFSGEYAFVATDDEIQLLVLSERDNWRVLDRIAARTVKLSANDNTLFFRLPSGRINRVNFNANGFSQTVADFFINGETIFYNFELHQNLLVVDTPTGVRWAQLSDTGRTLDVGVYYDSFANGEIVFNMILDDDLLYLQFSERLEIYLLSGDRKSVGLRDSILTPFAEIGTSLVQPLGDRLTFVNASTAERTWSIRTFLMREGAATQSTEVPALSQDLVGAASVAGRLFLASNAAVVSLDDSADLSRWYDAPPILQTGGPILAIAGEGDRLIVVFGSAGSGVSRLNAYDVNADGGLNQVYERTFQGAIDSLSIYQGAVAFRELFRTNDSEGRRMNWLLPHSVETYRRFVLDEDIAYEGLHLGPMGLAYHDGVTVTLHPSVEDPEIRTTYELDLEIQGLATRGQRLWIETAAGLKTFSLNSGKLSADGLYANLQKLRVLSDGKIIARSALQPGYIQLLDLVEDGVVAADFSFSAPDLPLLVTSRGDQVMLIHRESIGGYELSCPRQDFVYLIPVVDGIELELSNLVDEADLIQFRILGENNQLVGIQTLNAGQVAAFNGQPLESWLVDYNQLAGSGSIVITSATPLSPIISGVQLDVAPDASSNQSTELFDQFKVNFTPKVDAGRYAYRVRPLTGEPLFVPHVPRTSGWSTELILQGLNEGSSSIEVRNADGMVVEYDVAPGAADSLSISSASSTNATWLEILGKDPGDVLSGFSLLSNRGQSAAVPLINAYSDFLVVPYLAGLQDATAWTGLVLANPHERAVFLRVVGYDAQGGISLDRTLDLAAGASLIQVAEGFVDNLGPDGDVQWFTLFADSPLVGMMLVGNTEGNMAGAPLTAECGANLTFSGVRQANGWSTDVTLTNMETGSAETLVLAYDVKGQVLGSTQINLGPKESARFSTGDLFPDLGEDQSLITTLSVQSNRDLIGLMLRNNGKGGSDAVVASVLN